MYIRKNVQYDGCNKIHTMYVLYKWMHCVRNTHTTLVQVRTHSCVKYVKGPDYTYLDIRTQYVHIRTYVGTYSQNT